MPISILIWDRHARPLEVPLPAGTAPSEAIRSARDLVDAGYGAFVQVVENGRVAWDSRDPLPGHARPACRPTVHAF